MSDISRISALYQSNLATLVSLQSQLHKLETALSTASAYRTAIRENRGLRGDRNQLEDRLTEAQLMAGGVHVPLPPGDTCTPPVPPIPVFPLKRACELGQSESEPSPKLDKREITEKCRQSEVPKAAADWPKGDSRPKGAVPMGAERIKPERQKGPKGAEKGRGTDKPVEEDIPDISRMDFRIGKVLEVSKHPKADTLYIERIDCGDGEGRARQVVSGLVGKIPIQDIQDRVVVVCCNLKPREMRGVLSEAMVMCASTGDADDVTEFIDPPPGCQPGDPITFEGYTHKPDKQLNPKKKILEKVLAELKTDGNGIANYRGAPFRAGDRGVCGAKSLRNTIVK